VADGIGGGGAGALAARLAIGQLTQLTRDQTVRPRLANTPRPTSVDRALEDAQHVLTNAIGMGAGGPKIMVEHFRLADDDSVLLCTNGLTDMVSDSDIANTLTSRRTPQEQCDLLVDAAVAGGGTDNLTVVLLSYRVPA
jgi:protein phosphatase